MPRPVFDYESEGREFESLRARHLFNNLRALGCGNLGCNGVHCARIALQLESQAHLLSDTLTKANIRLQLAIDIGYSLRCIADPEFNQVFRHQIFAKMSYAVPPECME